MIRANIGVLELVGLRRVAEQRHFTSNGGVRMVRLVNQTLTTGAFFSGTEPASSERTTSQDADVGNGAALKVVGTNNAVNDRSTHRRDGTVGAGDERRERQHWIDRRKAGTFLFASVAWRRTPMPPRSLSMRRGMHIKLIRN